ncbi:MULTISPECIES: recombinase family protein [unclassified Streptomyces]|uniref:recombinase family protein n=1 Tax=unclassified Streptomyces TaxID=2593676 RepID=UPI00336AA473
MTEEVAAPTLAFIYDREATSQTDSLNRRLATCRAYAARMKWEVAGQWIDRGDAALTDRRPHWRGMVAAMEAQGQGSSFVCLVADWGRISHISEESVRLCQLVSLAGGVCVTAGGEDDSEEGASRGRLTAPPPPHGRAFDDAGKLLRRRGQVLAPGVTLMPRES